MLRCDSVSTRETVTPAPPKAPVALSQLKPGQCGVVREASVGPSDAALLGAMGLCCNAKVRLCRAGEPCLVAISTGRGAGCRIGLARPLAERIMVEPD